MITEESEPFDLLDQPKILPEEDQPKPFEWFDEEDSDWGYEDSFDQKGRVRSSPPVEIQKQNSD